MRASRLLWAGALSLSLVLGGIACSDDSGDDNTQKDQGVVPDKKVPKPDKGKDGAIVDLAVVDKGTTNQDGALPDVTTTKDSTIVHKDGSAGGKACTKAKTTTFKAKVATITGSIASTRKDNDVSFKTSMCTGQITPAAEDIYAIKLTAGNAYTFSAKPSTSYNLGIYLLSSCSTPLKSCVAGADSKSSGTNESFIYIPKVTGTYYLGVDSRYTAGSTWSYGTYTITVTDKGKPAKGDSCTNMLPLTWAAGKATATGNNKTFNPMLNMASSGCTYWDTEGNDVFYSLPVTKGKVYEVKVTPGSGWYAAVYALSSCSKTACIGGSDYGTSSGGPSEFMFVATKTGNQIIGVDSRYASTSSYGTGSYTLLVTEATPKAGAFCTKPTPMTFTAGVATVSGDTTNAKNDLVMGLGSCVGDDTVGPDLFYSFTAKKGQGYIVETTGVDFDSAIYVLTSCSINSCVAGADSSSGSTTGETLKFTANTAGTYIIGVDSDAAADKGKFTLKVSEFTALTNDKCSGAKTVTLTSGKGQVKGDTSNATNTVKLSSSGCVGWATSGPDVFYKFSATAGKQYLIKATPSATFDPQIYAFTKCGSEETTCLGGADKSYSGGGVESFKFTAKTTGTVYVAVDSFSASGSTYSGTFTLDITELTVAKHSKCSAAELVTLTSGKATVTGDTNNASDEFKTLICRSHGSTYSTSVLDGPQLYYKWGTTAGKWYKLTLTPKTTSQYLYIFSTSTCTASSIKTDCSSFGKTGTALGSVGTSYPRVVYYRAGAGGFSYFAVDSSASAGGFTVAIEELGAAPTNSKCATPEKLTWAAGKAVALGEVGPLLTPDEYKTLTCGTSTSAFDGGQAYYSVALTAGKTYDIQLKPTTGYYLYAYMFTNVCTAAKIGTDCQSAGKTGEVTSSSTGNSGSTQSFKFKAPKSGTYKIGVDSMNDTDFGGFKLTVQDFKAATNDTCATAQVVKLVNGKAKVTGTKGATATNQMKTCGSKSVPATDLFYKFTPVIGKKYKITFTPSGGGRFGVWDGAHNCDATKMSTACGVLGSTFVTSSGSLTITSKSGDVYFVADGISGFNNYSFTFDIAVQP